MITASLLPLPDSDQQRVRAWLAMDECHILLRSVQAQIDVLIQQGRLAQFDSELMPRMALEAAEHFEEAAALAQFARQLSVFQTSDKLFHSLEIIHDPNPPSHADTT